MFCVKEKFCGNIASFRWSSAGAAERKKLKQRELAAFLDITEVHYRRVEAGKINIPTLTLCALADYYGVTTDYLLGRSDQRG